MKSKLKEYKAKLEHELAEYLAQPVGTRSMAAVDAMIEYWEHVNDMERCLCHGDEFTAEDAEQWNHRMKNEDGSTGGALDCRADHGGRKKRWSYHGACDAGDVERYYEHDVL